MKIYFAFQKNILHPLLFFRLISCTVPFICNIFFIITFYLWSIKCFFLLLWGVSLVENFSNLLFGGIKMIKPQNFVNIISQNLSLSYHLNAFSLYQRLRKTFFSKLFDFSTISISALYCIRLFVSHTINTTFLYLILCILFRQREFEWV